MDNFFITGINEKQEAGSLKIYPNPAIQQITIELPVTGNTMTGTMSVFSMTGQAMIKRQVNGSKIKINVSSLPAGIYFVRLINNDNDRTPKGLGKFVKK